MILSFCFNINHYVDIAENSDRHCIYLGLVKTAVVRRKEKIHSLKWFVKGWGIFIFISLFSNILLTPPPSPPQLMTEILFGIRVIKFYAWEPHFSQKVADCRKQELKHLKAIKYLDAMCVYTWAALPVVISILTFVTYVLLGHQLTAPKVLLRAGLVVFVLFKRWSVRDQGFLVILLPLLLHPSSLFFFFFLLLVLLLIQVFTTLALVGMLIIPLNSFPWVLNGILEAKVSLERIQRFFKLTNQDLKAYYTLCRHFLPTEDLCFLSFVWLL